MCCSKTSTRNTVGACLLQDQVLMGEGLTLNLLSQGSAWTGMSRESLSLYCLLSGVSEQRSLLITMISLDTADPAWLPTHGRWISIPCELDHTKTNSSMIQ